MEDRPTSKGNAIVFVVISVLAFLFLALGGFYLYQKYSAGSSLPLTGYQQSQSQGQQPTLVNSGDPEVDNIANQADSSLSDVDVANNDLDQAVSDQPVDFSTDLQ